MSDIISYDDVEKRVLDLRGQKVLLDSDVAELYGVETKRINEAVRNNPVKFPDGYVLSLNSDEWTILKSEISNLSLGDINESDSLRSKISTLNDQQGSKRGQHSKYIPTAFTEKGLYMLATILKSPMAVQTTIAIVETFTKLRTLSQTMNQLAVVNDETQQKSLLQKSSKMLGDFLVNNIMEVSEDETSVELDLAIFKVKKTVKRRRRKDPTV